jgi:hypothetical protein
MRIDPSLYQDTGGFSGLLENISEQSGTNLLEAGLASVVPALFIVDSVTGASYGPVGANILHAAAAVSEPSASNGLLENISEKAAGNLFECGLGAAIPCNVCGLPSSLLMTYPFNSSMLGALFAVFGDTV